MLDFLAVCIAIFFLIQASEYLFKKKYIGSETSRKLIHMGTGVIVAFTPYFLEWREIQLLSIAFLLVIGVSSKFRDFRSIHSVKRITKGEILYTIGIGICALAAVVGLKWGKRTKYMLLSHGKSMLGSMTFFYVSMAIMFSAYLFVEPENLPDTFLLLIVAPAILTLLENISWYGSDNVTIPVMAIVLLSGLPG